MRVKNHKFQDLARRWDDGGTADMSEVISATSESVSPDEAQATEKNAAPNYDDLLKTDKSLQSWLDSRVSKASQTAVQNALEKERLLADEKASEAEKLAAMSEREKQEYLLKKAKDEIAQLKAEVNTRQLKDQAMRIAEEKKVPIPLAELLSFEHLKAEEVAERIDGIKTVYDQAVAAGISQALSGAGTPQGGSAEKSFTYSMDQIRSMSPDEINKNWDAIKASLGNG